LPSSRRRPCGPTTTRRSFGPRVSLPAGELSRAEAHYRAFLALRPESTGAAISLAAVLEAGDRWPRPRRSSRSCTATPAASRIALRLAELYERTGRAAAAEKLRRQSGQTRALRELRKSAR